MTKYSSKPGVDWPEIERRVRAGESFRSIEESLGTVSHQGIAKRARKEGWTEDARKALAATSFKVAKTNGKASIERKLEIIASLEKGTPYKVAAGAVGVCENTLLNWRNEDEAFAAECEAAEWRFVRKNVGRIDSAAERGDWKAAQFLLGKHPRSKETYADEKTAGGMNLQVILNIPKPGSIQEVIDITPSPVLIEGDR